MLVVTEQIRIPDGEIQFSFARSGGPGGQNVNKVNSQAILRWNVRQTTALPAPVHQRFLARYGHRLTQDGDLILRSRKYRDQPRNINDCTERLRTMILEVVKPPTPRKPTRPSRGAKQRRLQNKKKQSQKKQGRRRPSMND